MRAHAKDEPPRTTMIYVADVDDLTPPAIAIGPAFFVAAHNNVSINTNPLRAAVTVEDAAKMWAAIHSQALTGATVRWSSGERIWYAFSLRPLPSLSSSRTTDTHAHANARAAARLARWTASTRCACTAETSERLLTHERVERSLRGSG